MILERVNKLPPFVVRLLARDSRKGNGWHALTAAEIAKAGNLPLCAVRKISKLASWATVRIEDADKFSNGCGVDLSKPAKYLKEIRRSSLVHLRFASPSQRRLFAKLLATKA